MKNDMSIAKVIAMFMIVGCHLSEWFGVNIVAMILNVGVEIFLFVSGYLYSDKNIGGVKSFIKKKWMWSLRKRGSLQKKKQRVLEFRPDAVVVSLERYVTLVWQRQLRRPERQTAYRNICADTQKQRSDI